MKGAAWGKMGESDDKCFKQITMVSSSQYKLNQNKSGRPDVSSWLIHPGSLELWQCAVFPWFYFLQWYCWIKVTQQDNYCPRFSTLLHSYCTGTYTEVTVLLLWSNSTHYYFRVPTHVLQQMKSPCSCGVYYSWKNAFSTRQPYV